MDKLVSLVIINFNNKDYIERCMNSILNQTYKNLEIIFIDNNSKDGSFELFNQLYDAENIVKIHNSDNKGYSGGANQGIEVSKGEYIMLLNPDIILEEDFIYKLYCYAEKDVKIGALSGKLLKYDFKNDKKLNYIDSAGIEFYSNRKFKDRGQNEEDRGQYDSIERIFGVCGAAPFYRRSSLEDIKVKNEYFDEDFFAYKEDIDVSWRLNLAGFKCMYYPEAVAFHGRGLGGSKGGVLNFIKHRKSQSEFLRGISHRNHILLLEKNEFEKMPPMEVLKKTCRSFALIIYSLMYERFVFKYTMEAKRLIPKIREKRKIFMDNHPSIEDINHLIKK
ncbi:glycosyltransferase family 2 protein [Clostridium manihotivorum]|nr:glycosyltransferase family 2 protein [Clostridium manihotivorum]